MGARFYSTRKRKDEGSGSGSDFLVLFGEWNRGIYYVWK